MKHLFVFLLHCVSTVLLLIAAVLVLIIMVIEWKFVVHHDCDPDKENWIQDIFEHIWEP